VTREPLVEVRIQIDPVSEPINGVVRDQDGARRDFHGWLQLMAVVEAARSAGLSETQTQPPPTEET